jgi:hypothetical protein
MTTVVERLTELLERRRAIEDLPTDRRYTERQRWLFESVEVLLLRALAQEDGDGGGS